MIRAPIVLLYYMKRPPWVGGLFIEQGVGSNPTARVAVFVLFASKRILNCSTNWNLAGMPPRAIRAWCSGFRYCPNPLGIVPAEVFDKLEFVKAFLSENTYSFFHSMGK